MDDEKNIEDVSARSEAVSIWADILLTRVSDITPEIYSMSEVELEKFFKPTSVDFFLRKRFWEVTETSLKSGAKDVSLSEMYKGICTRQHFYNLVIKNHYRMSWILIPIRRHMDMIEEGFYFSLKKVREELLTMPVNEKTAGHLLKALEFFANRALGPMLQKIEQRSMNVNVDGNQAMREAFNPEDMQAKFAELQAKLVSLPSTAVTVDEPE